VIVLMALFVVPAPARAWNPTGHRVVASIAYRQLDEPTRNRVACVLKAHPAYAELWKSRPTNGKDERLNLLWNASIFPDDARRPPWNKFDRPLAHYVNFNIHADQANRVDQPVQGENVLNSYQEHVRKLNDECTPLDDKALRLSWFLHQIGDIHQPLHAVSRFSSALPDGDKGGNAVAFPNPRGRANLHAYWDQLLGIDEAPAAIEEIAERLIAEDPRSEFSEELSRTTICDWAEESVQISLKTVYKNLDPRLKSFADQPVGYEADATRAARRRAALAGYRLADELTRLFGQN
jgi:hypothetical protein